MPARSLLTVVLTLAVAPASSYRRHPVHELIIKADVIVTGSIKALNEGTYTFSVDAPLKGACGKHITVYAFEDWTCARRSREYAVGQRSLLFLDPAGDGKYYALGAGNEGDMALTADNRVVVEYPLKGYPTERFELEGARMLGAFVPLAEVRDAVELFPRAVEWDYELEDGEPTSRISSLRARDSQAALGAFAARSKFAGHLRYEVVTRPYYQFGEQLPEHQPIPGSLPRIQMDPVGFERELAWLGDMDGDGLPDWASLVGSMDSKRVQLALSRGSASHPVVLPLSADPASPAADWPELSGFGGTLQNVGDLDGNGYPELLVGQVRGEPRGNVRGDLWLVYLGERGTVLRAVSLGTQKPLSGMIAKEERPGKHPWPIQIGDKATCLGGPDQRGIFKVVLLTDPDVLGRTPPACYCVSINRQGVVLEVVPVLEPGSEVLLSVGSRLKLAPLGDVDGDGSPDLVIATPYHRDGTVGDEFGPGALIVVCLDPRGRARSTNVISVWQGGLAAPLRPGDQVVNVVVPVGDVDLDGTPDLLVGGSSLDYPQSGALWLLHLPPQGTVRTTTEIRDGRHGFTDEGQIPSAVAAAPNWSESGRLPLLLKGHVKAGDRFEPILWSLSLDRQGKLLPR